MAVHLSESRTLPVALDDAFARTMPAPLEQVFTSRSGPLPPVKEVRDQPATWDTVGQARTIVLADGGTMRETLTTVDRPHSFGYDLTDVTGAFKAIVTTASGSWAFEPVGTGCRVTWSWTLHPRGLVGRLAMPVLGRFWHGYARKALAELETNLTRS